MCLGRPKEPRFFTNFKDIQWTGLGSEIFKSSIISEIDQYIENFSHATSGQWLIDASTDYLWCEHSAKMIKKWSEYHETRLICILRDPIQRAISEYQHTVRDHLESGTLIQSIDQEIHRRERNWHPLFYHIRRSSYSEDCKKYAEIFGRDVLFLDYHELSNGKLILEKIENFLGLDPQEFHQFEKVNSSYVYRNKYLHSLIENKQLKSYIRPILPNNIRKAALKKLDMVIRRQYKPSEAEIERLREALDVEIMKCKTNEYIPTNSWQ